MPGAVPAAGIPVNLLTPTGASATLAVTRACPSCGRLDAGVVVERWPLPPLARVLGEAVRAAAEEPS